jgi:hypothetical protein
MVGYLSVEKELNSKACNAILDTAKVIYNEEIDRFKISETKTQILLAFTGIVFSFYINTLLKLEIEKEILRYLINAVFNLCIFLLLGYAIKSLIAAISMAKFEQVDIGDLVNKDFASSEECEVMMNIAATYRNAIRKNKDTVEQKMKYLTDALWYLKRAIILIIIYVFLKEVLGIV